MKKTPFVNDPDIQASTLAEEPPIAAPQATPVDESCLTRISKLLDSADAVLRAEQRPRSTTTLSVVMPVYNELSTIRQIVARVLALPISKELIIVDDGSTDGTREALALLEHEPDVRVIYQPCNQGKGAALRTALAHATGEIVVVQDADLEYDPRDILKLVEPILQGQADVVYGSRFIDGAEHDRSRVHRLGNRLLTAASNLMTGQRLTDMETCYKVFRRSALADVTLRQNRFGIEPELTAKIARRRLRIVERPISYSARGYADGKKIGLKDLINTLYCIVRYAVAE